LHAREHAAEDADVIPDAEPTTRDYCQPARVELLPEFAEVGLVSRRPHVQAQELGAERVVSLQPPRVPFHGLGVVAIREQVKDAISFVISSGSPHRNTFTALA